MAHLSDFLCSWFLFFKIILDNKIIWFSTVKKSLITQNCLLRQRGWKLIRFCLPLFCPSWAWTPSYFGWRGYSPASEIYCWSSVLGRKNGCCAESKLSLDLTVKKRNCFANFSKKVHRGNKFSSFVWSGVTPQKWRAKETEDTVLGALLQ